MPIRVDLRSRSGEVRAIAGDIDQDFVSVVSNATMPLPMLMGIDLYGRTIFNRQQMPMLRRDLNDVRPLLISDEQKDMADRITDLCLQGEASVHEYIWCIGD